MLTLEGDLVPEFDRIIKFGVKISTTTLLAIAKDMVKNSEKESYFANNMCSLQIKKLLTDLINAAWMQRFMIHIILLQVEKLVN